LKVSSAWLSCFLAALLPTTAALVILYSDVQTLKMTKADTKEMLELKVEMTRQLTRNTTAIENLNETLKTFRGGNT
jgi:hypothetical protein